LLQCRTQSYVGDSKPAEIPEDIPDEKIIFNANRFISNGIVPNITNIVYVDPQKYSELSSQDELLAVGKAIGKLNSGSRGDIKLGVSITYSDINNSSMLIEIARKKKDYVPDLSFGTHFFQDLVEGNIRYLPLYPDDEGIIFNEDFLTKSKNILPDVLPEVEGLSDVIKIINVPNSTGGEVLNILMNADMEMAVGILTSSDQ
jgi:hypothetical protein